MIKNKSNCNSVEHEEKPDTFRCHFHSFCDERIAESRQIHQYFRASSSPQIVWDMYTGITSHGWCSHFFLYFHSYSIFLRWNTSYPIHLYIYPRFEILNKDGGDLCRGKLGVGSHLVEGLLLAWGPLLGGGLRVGRRHVLVDEGSAAVGPRRSCSCCCICCFCCCCRRCCVDVRDGVRCLQMSGGLS